MGSTSITSAGLLYLTSAFQRPGLLNPSGHFVPPTIFEALRPILGHPTTTTIHQECPLDLSSKLFQMTNSAIRQASVIQHTKSIPGGDELLPTCPQPRVNLESLHRSKSPENYTLYDEAQQKQNDDNSSNQSATNRLSYPREFKLMVIEYFYANGQNKYRTCKE